MSIIKAVILLALLGAGAQAALVKGTVEVGKIGGLVTLKDGSGRTANLTSGATFNEGHTVETATNSTVELLLSNGSSLLVKPETTIEFKVFTQVSSNQIVAGKYRELSAEPSVSIVQIELHRGKIVGEARKLNPSSQFTVKSPVAVTRVRGTVWIDEYIVDPVTGKGTHTTTVINGNVEVRPLSQDDPIPVAPKTNIVITLDPSKPLEKSGITLGAVADAYINELVNSLPEGVSIQVSVDTGTGTVTITPVMPPPGSPPTPPIFDKIIIKEVQENVSPSGG